MDLPKMEAVSKHALVATCAWAFELWVCMPEEDPDRTKT